MADYNKSGALPISVAFESTVDTSNPLTSHIWKVDGVTDPIVGSTFIKTFTAYKDYYTIEHSGSNTCGSNCIPVTKTISITETPQFATGGIPIEIIIGGLVGVGFLGYIWTTMPKSPRTKSITTS